MIFLGILLLHYYTTIDIYIYYYYYYYYMPNQVFYLSLSNYEKIRTLPNMSSLINSLLEGHFEAIAHNDASVDNLEEGIAKIEKEYAEILTKKQAMALNAKENVKLQAKDQETEIQAFEERKKETIAKGKKRAEYEVWYKKNPRKGKDTDFKAWLKAL